MLCILSCGRKPDNANAENIINKKYSDFWIYFKSVETKAENISELEPEEQKELLDGFKEELIKIDSNLALELSGQKKEVVVTSGGIKSSFPNVEKLVKSAPQDLGWKVPYLRYSLLLVQVSLC